MAAARKRLLVLEEDQSLPGEVHNPLRKSYELAAVRSGEDLLGRLGKGTPSGVLIPIGSDARRAIVLAARIKKAHPATVVILLGDLRAPDKAQDAFGARVDAIVNAEDAAGLDAALASRLGLPATPA